MQPTITINGIEVYRRNWFAALHELKPVASYHLGCPAPQLEFLLVKRTGREPTQIAARGCGRQALFRRPDEASLLICLRFLNTFCNAGF